MKHLVLVSDLEFEDIVSGKSQYLVRFFKKRFDFVLLLAKGDLVYLRKKRGEVLGQFNVGKVVLIDGLETSDFKILKDFSKDLSREVFEKKASENSIIIIVQIEKLEQFITSPIEIPKQSRKEWIVLD